MNTHPRRIGKYAIETLVGEGAMGRVYRALDPDIGRVVAIKTLRRDVRPAGTAGRFLNEARAVGRLSHPGIVTIHEYGMHEGLAYIVMEFIEGRTLASMLDAVPVPGERSMLRLMDQLLDALDCAHRAGVLHRDVKPGNLIDTPQRQLKVTDFGVARIEGSELTQVAASIGTPGHMAPEQYSGRGAGPQTDVFGAGVLLYRMLSGRLPFRGTPENILYKLFNETPPPPSRLPGAHGRDARYDALTMKALARDPEARFATADEFRAALRETAMGGRLPPSARRTGTGTDAMVTLDGLAPTGGWRATSAPTGGTAGDRADTGAGPAWGEAPGGAPEGIAGRSQNRGRARTTGDAAGGMSAQGGMTTDAMPSGGDARAESRFTGRTDGQPWPDARRGPGSAGTDLVVLSRQLAESIDATSRDILRARQRGMGMGMGTGTGTGMGTDGSTGAPGPAGALPVSATRSAPALPPAPVAMRPAADDAITPERLTRLHRRLARHVGPIARVMIRRAQSTALGHADLLRRLADDCAIDDTDRSRLLTMLFRED